MITSRLLRSRQRRRVLVTCKSGAVFDGVLFDVDSSAFVLRSCMAVGSGQQQPVPVDGELLLLLADVDFIQKP